ncbi:hypothetical protein ACMFMG_002167 [Clarireedia jacksonii]
MLFPVSHTISNAFVSSILLLPQCFAPITPPTFLSDYLCYPPPKAQNIHIPSHAPPPTTVSRSSPSKSASQPTNSPPTGHQNSIVAAHSPPHTSPERTPQVESPTRT